MRKNNILSILSLGLELIPVALFFLASLWWNIYIATGFLMAGSILSMTLYYFMNKKLPILGIVLVILTLIFGTLTIIFHKDYIIKIKVTILDIIIAVMFFGAAYWKKNIIAPITPKFARKPSFFVVINNSWGIFFVLLAIANEFLWRHLTTQEWIYFKTAGVISLVIIFALIQTICLLLYILYRKSRVLNKHYNNFK